MKTKHIPIRQCIVCGERFEKKDLFRIAATSEEIKADAKNSFGGRGAYICKNPDCVDKLIKKRGLDRAFKKRVENETYDKILKEIDQNN